MMFHAARKMLAKGTEVVVVVLSINTAQGRFSLGPP